MSAYQQQMMITILDKQHMNFVWDLFTFSPPLRYTQRDDFLSLLVTSSKPSSRTAQVAFVVCIPPTSFHFYTSYLRQCSNRTTIVKRQLHIEVTK